MEVFIVVVMLLLGIALIVKGGDFFVDAASWIAEVSGIPRFIIGATVVSLATTLPEMLVSVIAAASGKAEMAVGNAVGTVVSNTGLIMALPLLFMPFSFKRSEYLPKSALMLVSILMIFALSLSGTLNAWLSLLLFIPLALFLWENISSAKREMSAGSLLSGSKQIEIMTDQLDFVEVSVAKTELELAAHANLDLKSRKTVLVNLLKFALGVLGIVFGAQFLVEYASQLARMLGASEGLIAVTIVAIGTSLPELVTTVTAISKKKCDMSIGNVLGANIIDLTIILPVCALIGGGSILITKSTLYLDLPFAFIIAAVGVVPAMFKKRFMRWQGAAMLVLYVTYIALRATIVF